MKKISAILLAMTMMIGLAGCSSPAASSSGAEACEHQWSEATYHAPQTCQLCGGTQGEPAPDYFAANSIPLAQTIPQEEMPLTFITYEKDNAEHYATWDGGIATMSQTIQPSDREGYKVVTLTVNVVLPIKGLPEFADTIIYYSWSNNIYDMYTGRLLPGRSMDDDDQYDYQTDVSYDGNTYEIFYSKENVWNTDGWYYNEQGEERIEQYVTQTYVMQVPEEYDGLVYGLVPVYSPALEYDYEVIDEEERYPKDLEAEERIGGVENMLEESIFIRFGQENPNQQQEEAGSSAAGDASGQEEPAA